MQPELQPVYCSCNSRAATGNKICTTPTVLLRPLPHCPTERALGLGNRCQQIFAASMRAFSREKVQQAEWTELQLNK